LLSKDEILACLRQERDAELDQLWARADAVRSQNVGDEVHLRGLIELSNYCRRHCLYCGIRLDNQPLPRYRMSREEILACVREAVAMGYGTVVMQAGEDPVLNGPWVAELVKRIKSDTPLAVTLSLGERDEADYALWREAGADRYLLRFETSNPAIFDRIHPSLPGRKSDRVSILRQLRQLGYEIGSGVMIGIPGQTYDDLANDILLFS
jgi:biotin synthase